MKRECYSLGRRKGQTEETLCVGRGRPTNLLWIIAASGGDLPESVRDPRRLVALPAVRHGREVRRIGLDQQAIPWHHPNEIVVSPLLERHNPAERDVPTGGDREFCQRLGAGIAVQDSDNPRAACLVDHGSRIVLGVTSVDDNRTPHLVSERNLRREGATLSTARRVVVVVVEAALPHRDRAAFEISAKLRYVALDVERRGIVRVNARRSENEARILRGALSGDRGSIDGLADADDRDRTRIAGAGDYRVAVAGERCVREVGVAIDED